MCDDVRGEVLRLRREALSWRVLADEVIAVDLRDSRYLTANASGAVLWQALAAGATREELAAALVVAYDVPGELAKSDVDRFLADAEARGLLA